MTPEPDQRAVELAKRGFEAFSSGDWDVAVQTLHPDIEWHAAFVLPDLPPGKTVFRGRDEVRELWSAFASIWETITIEMESVERVRSEGDLSVIVMRCRFRGEGGASGVQVDRVLHYALEIEEDFLTRMQPFDTETEALAAAGFEPET